MPPPNRKPGGWLFPGYKYLGPFNPIDNGEPVNAADAAAKQHDLDYDKYIKKGINPYWKFNKADSDFLNRLSGDRSLGGNVAKGVFKLKRLLAPTLKEPPEEPPIKKAAPGKNTDRAQKRKLYFARSNKGAKKDKQDVPNNMDGDNTTEQTDQPMEQTAAGDGRAGAAGGSGAMGAGGSRGAGVGISTGGWIGGTTIHGNKIVTRNTRQWYCGIQNEHLYKRYIAPTGNVQLYGFTTPWNYFNFNQYSSHFNPKEWQWLLNNCKRFRPVKMSVALYNLQIKQIVVPAGGGDATYNNDLTAGLHVFCDGEHAYPYVQHAWDQNCMPENPWETWLLSQYAYTTVPAESVDQPGTSTTENTLLQMEPMYYLEDSDHEVLRTGESTQFHFDFNCGWVNNTRASQQPQAADLNPLIAQRLVKPYQTSGGGNHLLTSVQKPSNWLPGPGCTNNRITPSGSSSNGVLGPLSSDWKPNGYTQDSSPGFTGIGATSITGQLAPQSNKDRIGFVPGDPAGLSTEVQPIWVDTALTATRDLMPFAPDGTTWNQQNTWWMLPNQVWDSAPINRYNPIWTKIPRVDRHTLIDTQDGTLPMTHPPGTIYVKLANIPVPGASRSYLNVYVTGQVACEIEWEFEYNINKNWRPERRHTVTSMNNAAYKVNEAGVYKLPTTYTETMPSRFGHTKVL